MESAEPHSAANVKTAAIDRVRKGAMMGAIVMLEDRDEPDPCLGAGRVVAGERRCHSSLHASELRQAMYVTAPLEERGSHTMLRRGGSSVCVV